MTNQAINGHERSHPLYALMLKLRPKAAGECLPNAGQQAHAALLAWLAAVDPALATRLHEPNNDRPFTCSSLWFPDERAVALAQRENRRLTVLPAQTYWLRLTLLTDELFRTLIRRFLQPNLTPTIASTPGTSGTSGTSGAAQAGLPALRLGSVHFEVAELVALAQPDEASRALPTSWAGYDTYEALVERAGALDLAMPAARTVGLLFRSPTAFSDGQQEWGKKMHLFPDPERVFDRLARLWNAFAPEAFALDVPALREYVAQWVAVSAYALETRSLHFDRHAQVGFVGRCSYALMERAHPTNTTNRRNTTAAANVPVTLGAGLRPWQALHLLAAFAFYAGVGQKTTMGMGQARPLPPASIPLEMPAANISRSAPKPLAQRSTLTPARAAVPATESTGSANAISPDDTAAV